MAVRRNFRQRRGWAAVAAREGDAAVAARAGVSRSSVRRWRVEAGFPACRRPAAALVAAGVGETPTSGGEDGAGLRRPQASAAEGFAESRQPRNRDTLRATATKWAQTTLARRYATAAVGAWADVLKAVCAAEEIEPAETSKKAVVYRLAGSDGRRCDLEVRAAGGRVWGDLDMVRGKIADRIAAAPSAAEAVAEAESASTKGGWSTSGLRSVGIDPWLRDPDGGLVFVSGVYDSGRRVVPDPILAYQERETRAVRGELAGLGFRDCTDAASGSTAEAVDGALDALGAERVLAETVGRLERRLLDLCENGEQIKTFGGVALGRVVSGRGPSGWKDKKLWDAFAGVCEGAAPEDVANMWQEVKPGADWRKRRLKKVLGLNFAELSKPRPARASLRAVG